MTLHECIIYQVLSCPEEWTIEGSMREIFSFWTGVRLSASNSDVELPEWKTSGTLRAKKYFHLLQHYKWELDQSIIKKSLLKKHTFHCTRILRRCLAEDFSKNSSLEVVEVPLHALGYLRFYHNLKYEDSTEKEFWKSIMKRPFILMGDNPTSLEWYAFFQGCCKGAKWLGIEPPFYAEEIDLFMKDFVSKDYSNEKNFYVENKDNIFYLRDLIMDNVFS